MILLLDTLTICDVLGASPHKKNYRITKVKSFNLYEQIHLTRHHHLKKKRTYILTDYKNV
ncbi:MAG: hypothetical protein ACLR9T_04300 [Thomasclavelia sp.]|uniref:hypothetical protein n=1 Tax=Thomasclavelia sp. TaxID=3025757 RepID=UPI0039A28367